MKKIVLFTLLTFTVIAPAQAEIGLKASISTKGLFNAELTEFIIEAVTEGSPAQKAGLKAGDIVIAIADCKIPGCDASDAKKLMKRKAGEILPLTIKKEDGTEQVIAIHVE
ncbi:PDZ domain-containing protein [Neptunicella marina]|uniref:PDZ domain-containing protein n=1 Tax=Neptunicella marina TaxID=2125989 RepID=A0A8J6IRT4_9ALTE|nr:PDZ domain-containing protein [Neptunicella marina]MBC3765214.1 PDZ domain-containing protein [Neptunicella marina]